MYGHVCTQMETESTDNIHVRSMSLLHASSTRLYHKQNQVWVNLKWLSVCQSSACTCTCLYDNQKYVCMRSYFLNLMSARKDKSEDNCTSQLFWHWTLPILSCIDPRLTCPRISHIILCVRLQESSILLTSPATLKKDLQSLLWPQHTLYWSRVRACWTAQAHGPANAGQAVGSCLVDCIGEVHCIIIIIYYYYYYWSFTVQWYKT